MAEWDGPVRRDGLVRVLKALSGAWIAVPAHSRYAMLVCRCCRQPLATEDAARAAADHVWRVSRNRDTTSLDKLPRKAPGNRYVGP